MSSFQNLSNSYVEDPAPGEPIEDVNPLSKRAFKLVHDKKASSRLLTTNSINIVGAIDMMEGLDYHHQNYLELLRSVQLGNTTFRATKPSLTHEVVAYINRVGQFYHFAISALISETIGDQDSSIATIKSIVRIRNKHTAHRSIDAPRRESEHEKERQAMLFSGTFFNPRTGRSTDIDDSELDLDLIHKKLCQDSFVSFQFREEASYFNFSIEEQHSQVMTEAYEVVSKLVNFP